MKTFKQFLNEMPFLLSKNDQKEVKKRKIKNSDVHNSSEGEDHIDTMKSGHHLLKSSHGMNNSWVSYKAYNPKEKRVDMRVYGHESSLGREKPTLQIKMLHKHEKNEGHLKAHDFYHHILKHTDLMSDTEHTEGSKKAWHELSKKKDVKVKRTFNSVNPNRKEDQKRVFKKNFDKNYGEWDRFHASLKEKNE